MRRIAFVTRPSFVLASLLLVSACATTSGGGGRNVAYGVSLTLSGLVTVAAGVAAIVECTQHGICDTGQDDYYYEGDDYAGRATSTDPLLRRRASMPAATLPTTLARPRPHPSPFVLVPTREGAPALTLEPGAGGWVLRF